MTSVVDTSVALAWYVDEASSEAALPYLGAPLIAPSLIMVEMANAVWKKVRRNEIPELQAHPILLAAGTAVQSVPFDHLLPRSLELALTLRHPVYDCIFLAVAEANEMTLVTADRKFAKACRGTLHYHRREVI